MMKALIVEDERMAQAQLVRLLKVHFPDIEVVQATDSVRATVEYLSADPPLDLIFMDVELSDGECFEIFRQVAVHAQVIMTTAYDSYALKAFEAGSIDYLLKPIGEDAFTGSGERYLVESTLDALEGELDPERFFRISRGAIVARSAVRSVSRHFSGRLKLELQPAPPFEPTVSRARVDDFLKWLE